MARVRDVLRVQRRAFNFVELTLPIRAEAKYIRLLGAANLNDAHGTPGGVSANSPIEMFRLLSGMTFVSPGLQGTLSRAQLDQSSKGLTRIVYDPDEYDSPLPTPGAGTVSLPPDTQTAFLRASVSEDNSTWSDGPIVMLPPADFNVVSQPVITVTGNAPDLGLGIGSAYPDALTPELGTMNFHLPYYCGSIALTNQDSTYTIWVAFAPGTPPYILRPNSTLQLTVGGIPEILIAADGGNPQFTVVFSCVNRTG